MRPIAIGAAVVLLTAAAAPDYSFVYDWPDAVETVPALRRLLAADRTALRTEAARTAAADRRAAARHDYPFRPHAAERRWQVVTETPRVLSLSSDSYSFSGGAHGNSATGSLLWDKAAGRRVGPMVPFVSPAAIERAIRPAWCAALTAERSRRRGGAVGGAFADCPPLTDLTLLLGSTDRQRIDRIGLVADPYVAGPYAEGRYEVTLPVTAEVLAAVKPGWRRAFALGR
ncbi:MAG: DUF4163 domain-containing protein [Sphingomonas fennica]